MKKAEIDRENFEKQLKFAEILPDPMRSQPF